MMYTMKIAALVCVGLTLCSATKAPEYKVIRYGCSLQSNHPQHADSFWKYATVRGNELILGSGNMNTSVRCDLSYGGFAGEDRVEAVWYGPEGPEIIKITMKGEDKTFYKFVALVSQPITKANELNLKIRKGKANGDLDKAKFYINTAYRTQQDDRYDEIMNGVSTDVTAAAKHEMDKIVSKVYKCSKDSCYRSKTRFMKFVVNADGEHRYHQIEIPQLVISKKDDFSVTKSIMDPRMRLEEATKVIMRGADNEEKCFTFSSQQERDAFWNDFQLLQDKINVRRQATLMKEAKVWMN